MTQFFKAHWREIAVVGLLFVASCFAASLIVARRYILGSWNHYFLVWNLFLAWIPLGVAFVLKLMNRPPLPLLLIGSVVWLAFLPNAPYIMTDLIHFRWSHSVVWLDWSMFLAFALTGLFAGFASLTWMQAIVRARFGSAIAHAFTLLSLVGCGIGVYIGRFLRWNSWDIVTRPEALMLNIFNQYFSPETFVHTWALSGIFALIFAFCFGMVRLLSTESNHEIQPRSTQFASGD